MKPTTSTNRVRAVIRTSVSMSAAAILFVLLVLVCGAGASSLKSEPTPEPVKVANRPAHLPKFRKFARTTIQLRIGGVPSDSVISFQLKLDSMVATNTDGSKAELLTTPVSVEIMHWAGDSEIVAISSLLRGQYNQVAITAKASSVTFMDPLSGLMVTKTLTTKYATTMKFNPVLTVAATPVVLNLQVNPTNLLSATPLGGNATGSSQVFRIAAYALNSLGLQPETGKVERIVGSVTSISSTALTVLDGQTGSSLTFKLEHDTEFRSATRSTLLGLIVAVRGRADKYGALVATDIEAFENQNGSVVDGIARGYTPDSNLVTLVMQDGSGTGVNSSLVGSGLPVDPSQNPNFVVDAHDIDMTGMGSLTFDKSSLMLGQHVQVQSLRGIQCDSNGKAAAVTPETLMLEPQALIGKVSNYQSGNTLGTSSFDLVFATDAYMNVLNPFFYTMHVYQQRGTELHGLPAGIGNGTAVRVWGLVFYSKLPQANINQPAFLMVAGRITGN